MSNTEQTKKDIDEWNRDDKRAKRYNMLQSMSVVADIEDEFLEVPKLHFQNMSYDQFMINVYAMSKIYELRRIADK